MVETMERLNDYDWALGMLKCSDEVGNEIGVWLGELRGSEDEGKLKKRVLISRF